MLRDRGLRFKLVMGITRYAQGDGFAWGASVLEVLHGQFAQETTLQGSGFAVYTINQTKRFKFQ